MKIQKKLAKFNKKSGFTLVELIVAAVVLLVIVISVASLVRYMRREQNLDYHRRQARAVINRTFENVFAYTFFPGPYTFQDRNVFAGFVTDEDGEATEEEKWESLKLSVDHSEPIVTAILNGENTGIGTGADGFDLDRRGGEYASIPAVMYVRLEHISETIAGSNIVTHLITLTVEWTEIGETVPERVTLTKRLSGVL